MMKRENQTHRTMFPAWNRYLFLAIAVIGFSLPLQATASSQQAAGKIIFVFGDAWRHSVDGGKHELKRGMLVHVGETVETSPTGQVQMRMNDNGLISIRPSSQFKIKAFKFSGQHGAGSEDDKTYFQLLQGGFRSITGAVGENNKKAYKVVTPVATIGIRGTDYSARLCESDCDGKSGLYVGVWQGGIRLNNDGGTLDVDAGGYGYVAGVGTAGVSIESLPAELLLANASTEDENSKRDGETVIESGTLLAGVETEMDIEPVALTDIGSPIVSLPSTGTANYTLDSISGSNSTTGATVGAGSSASLSADFGAMTVDASVNLNLTDGSNWQGSASAMSLQDTGDFQGGMVMGTSTNALSETSLSGSGSMNGSLTGQGNGTVPTGASLNFDMTSDFPSTGTESLSGSASFIQ
ncbi:MAG: FecR domain-containing protein [Gammaproteobacteria bacterium]|nr:FecR domain-containing protein [Gammaproteobacteria bacterium]